MSNNNNNNWSVYFEKIEQEILINRRLIQDLIQILAPLFPREASRVSSNEEIEQALDDAEREAIANALNPNLRSKRSIPKVLEEAKVRYQQKATKTNVTPSAPLRLYALLKHLKYIKGQQNELTDDDVQPQYNTLKYLARDVLKDMERANINIVGKTWSEIGEEDTSIQERYALLLEKRALDVGLHLHLCVEMWAAKLLLSEALKNKKTVRTRSNSAEEGESQQNQESVEDNEIESFFSVDNQHILVDRLATSVAPVGLASPIASLLDLHSARSSTKRKAITVQPDVGEDEEAGSDNRSKEADSNKRKPRSKKNTKKTK